jgi:two-component system phosphate regulon response regulator OmpR
MPESRYTAAAMGSNVARILVVDDDLRLRTLLEEYLTEQGFAVVPLPDGRRVSQVVVGERIDLVVLDLMLPGEDGLSVCKRLRGAGLNVPIIMLTAKGDTVDRIVGLDLGADDYMPKPFEPRELVSRITAVLRRQARVSTASVPNPGEVVYDFGPFQLDTGCRRLTRSGQVITLTTGEFAVLQALVSHPRQPLSREQLVKLSRRRHYGAYDRSMDVQVARLRRLIEDDLSNPRYIQTVWGFGYVFVPEGTSS